MKINKIKTKQGIKLKVDIGTLTFNIKNFNKLKQLEHKEFSLAYYIQELIIKDIESDYLLFNELKDKYKKIK